MVLSLYQEPGHSTGSAHRKHWPGTRPDPVKVADPVTHDPVPSLMIYFLSFLVTNYFQLDHFLCPSRHTISWRRHCLKLHSVAYINLKISHTCRPSHVLYIYICICLFKTLRIETGEIRTIIVIIRNISMYKNKGHELTERYLTRRFRNPDIQLQPKWLVRFSQIWWKGSEVTGILPLL